MKQFLAMSLLALLLSGCGNTNNTVTSKQKEESKQTEQKEVNKEKATSSEVTKSDSNNKVQEQKTINPTAFTTYTTALSGKTFMKEATATGDKGNITYFNNFTEYKAANPNSKLTENDYKLYFNTGDGIEKTLFEATSYLFNKIPEMNELSVTLPFEGKVYSYIVKKDQISSYIGKDRTDDKIRKEFIQKFVTVK